MIRILRHFLYQICLLFAVLCFNYQTTCILFLSEDGTTDVTRTLHYGEPTFEQKEAYTRVLIGSIQLASLVFPPDLRTDQLDILAREPLWTVGRDYQHGTGHGIGHFLSVHECK